MYEASLIVVAAVALMVLFWAIFMVWVMRSGQLTETNELSRRPLEDESPGHGSSHD
jgi:hypothetical protein